MMMGFPLLLALSAPANGCHVIDNDYIQARDVAAVAPAFGKIEEDFNLGLLPTTGTPRILRGVDLQRIARNRGVELEALPDICFQRRTFIPTEEQIREAMRTSLKIDGVKIDVVSSSQHPAPAGELVFPMDGLQASTAHKEQLWRGFVRYGDDRSFPVWAKVRVTASVTRVVALKNLPAGKPIRENQVRLESCEDSPLDQTTARNLDEVLGYLPKTSVRAMTAIHKTQLERPPDVRRGDLVRVRVSEGAAHLELEGRAQTSGVTGGTVVVRNVSSGRDFRAEVTGKNQVAVTLQ